MPDIAVQLWSVRDELESPERLFEGLAETGIVAVEPFGFGGRDLTSVERLARANRVSRAATAAGLRVSSVHTNLPEPAEAALFIDEMHALGAPYVLAAVPESLSGFGRDAFETEDGLSRYADRMNALSDVLQPESLQLGYHNHGFEWNTLPDGRLAYDVLWDHLDDRVIAEVDVYWAQSAGQDATEIVGRLGDRVKLLHIDDCFTGQESVFQLPAGTGDIRLAEAIRAGSPHVEVYVIEATTAAPGTTMLQLISSSARWLDEQILLQTGAA